MEDLDEVFFVDSDYEEEEFRSCLAEEDDWKEFVQEVAGADHDDLALRLFFKGVSAQEGADSGSRVSGIGVTMERSPGGVVYKSQKRLDFYVEESVAEHLALMDGLLEALRRDERRVLAFTDSEVVYDQIENGRRLQNELLTALRERILEHASKLELFAMQLVPSDRLREPLLLAREAIGDGTSELCSICCEEKLPSQFIDLNCSHKFCSQCLITYTDKKLLTLQPPIKCPQFQCKYVISPTECKKFLSSTSYEKLKKVLAEVGVYCPYPDCSVLLNVEYWSSARERSSCEREMSYMECPECQRSICTNCVVPWHSSLSCAEYQNLPGDERDAGDISLHQLAQNQRWRRCQQCRRMIELTQGCYHITCWCGHEFCYSCGADYRDGQQTCQCAFWDDGSFETISNAQTTLQEDIEPWRWDSFDSLPSIADGYSNQEISQLTLIQRFLSGGFGLSDHHPFQSHPQCSDSYSDTIKDLHQLPWLERFVSVISDNCYDDYVQ